MDDLVWERIFFQTSSIIYVMSDIYFFTAGYYFSQLYPSKLFLLEISLQDIIHNPLMVGP